MDEICEFLKNFIPTSILLTFPILFLLVPIQYSHASNEFSIYRMQQFNFYGVPHGCRSSSFSLEAKSISTWKTSRHCVITRLKDLTNYRFIDIVQQAGALLVMLPKDMSSLSNDEKTNIIQLEQTMIAQDVFIPVYFIPWDKELQNIIRNVDLISASSNSGSRKETAVDALLNSVFAMGYQIVVNAPKPNPIFNAFVPVIQAVLRGHNPQGGIPSTIVLVAHFDAQSSVPELSFGADSNGSGVAVILELARLFSKLYSKPRTQPRYNLIFLLSGGGKLSYMGSKKWIDELSEMVDTNDDENGLLKNVAFVLCLDALAANRGINAHVSKPPKNGTMVHRFIEELRKVALDHASSVEMIHKKINLAEQMLAWEHERFSMKRVPAFTISSLNNHKDWKRASIFDTVDTINYSNLYLNTKILAEALARLMYGFTESNVLITHKVELDSLKYGLKFIGSHSRSSQLLAEKDNSLVTSLHYIMSKYMSCNITYMQAEKSEPEFVIYDLTKSSVFIYSVKPAIFDLVLTFIIAAYISLVYFMIQKFPLLYAAVQATVGNKKKIQ